MKKLLSLLILLLSFNTLVKSQFSPNPMVTTVTINNSVTCVGLADGKVTVYSTYGGGGGSMEDLAVSGFNWSINSKNQYECTFTAIGPTSVLPEFNMRAQIKETGLTFEQPRIIGPPKNVPVSGIPSLIEYDIQQGNGMPSDDVEDGTYISKSALATRPLLKHPPV